MSMRKSPDNWLPLIIILIGVGYLLYNVDIISFTPWKVLVKFWPAIIVYYGVKNLIQDYFATRVRHSSSLIFNSIVILIGLNLLLPRLGFQSIAISWNLLWPIILIIFGIQMYTESNRQTRPYKVWALIGEFDKRGEAWYVEDLSIHQCLGEVNIDLTRAVIPSQEIFFDISMGIGEITIYLPNDLPIKANCSIKYIGEVTVLGETAEGIRRTISFETIDYQSAERKLNLRASVHIGEITVRRIG